MEKRHRKYDLKNDLVTCHSHASFNGQKNVSFPTHCTAAAATARACRLSNKWLQQTLKLSISNRNLRDLCLFKCSLHWCFTKKQKLKCLKNPVCNFK